LLDQHYLLEGNFTSPPVNVIRADYNLARFYVVTSLAKKKDTFTEDADDGTLYHRLYLLNEVTVGMSSIAWRYP
jgi:hypothetical protein